MLLLIGQACLHNPKVSRAGSPELRTPEILRGGAYSVANWRYHPGDPGTLTLHSIFPFHPLLPHCHYLRGPYMVAVASVSVP